jgi:hypothetical protein
LAPERFRCLAGDHIYKKVDDGTTVVEGECVVDIVGDLPTMLMEIEVSSGTIGSLKITKVKQKYYLSEQAKHNCLIQK